MDTVQKYEIGDCLSLLPSIPDKSVNLILTDLPYGQTACAWDSIIPLEPLWAQYKRILTDNGAVVLTCTFKFGISLVNTNPDMFRYDLVWEKTRATGFLNANKMPMRNHELILVFYNKLPTFNPQYTKGKAYTRLTNTASKIYNNEPNYVGTVVDKDTRNPVSVIKPDNINLDKVSGGECYSDHFDNTGYIDDGTRHPTSVIKQKTGNKGGSVYGEKPRLDTDDHKPNVEGARLPTSVIKYYRSSKTGAYGDLPRDNKKIAFDEDGPRRETSILKHANANNHTNHPTQKPLSLFEYFIKTYTNEGDMVHDSCLGAGTTLEACVNLNRDCIGFELSKEWEDNYKKILDSKKNMYKLSKIFGRKLK